jgi:uncharacterized protein (TIGR02246 family)
MSRILLAAAAGSLLATSPGVAAAPDSVERAKAEIAAARDAFWAAHAKGDAKALAGLLTEDARLLAPGMEDVSGRQAIEAAAAQMFQSLTVEDFTIESSELAVHGDSAVELSTYSETLRPKDGPAASVKGRYLIVWRRDRTGRWKVHRNMFNFIRGGH